MPAGWLKYPKDVALKIPVVIIRQTTAIALKKIIARDEVVHAQVRTRFLCTETYRDRAPRQSNATETETEAEQRNRATRQRDVPTYA